MPACGKYFGRPIRSRAAGPAAACSRPPMAERRGQRSASNEGLPKPLWGKLGVSVSGADSNRFYAIIEAPEGGVFVSDDAGADVEADQRRSTAAAAGVLLHAHLRRPAGERHRLHPQHRRLSLDRRGQNDPRDTRSAWRQPRSLDRAERSKAHDQQQRWRRERLGQRRERPGPIRTFRPRSSTTSFTTAHVPYHVCGAQQDNTTACVSSTGSGSLYDVGGGESGYIAPDPQDTDVFYAGSYGGLLTRINRRTGEAARDQCLAGQSDGVFIRRHHRTVPVDLSDRDRSHRSPYPLRHVAACLEIDATKGSRGSVSVPT